MPQSFPRVAGEGEAGSPGGGGITAGAEASSGDAALRGAAGMMDSMIIGLFAGRTAERSRQRRRRHDEHCDIEIEI